MLNYIRNSNRVPKAAESNPFTVVSPDNWSHQQERTDTFV